MNCQSCGIFIMRPAEFGTNAVGAKVLDYCRLCYDKGVFTEPDMTFERMVERISTPMKINRNMPDEEARAQAKEKLSKLKRWNKE